MTSPHVQTPSTADELRHDGTDDVVEQVRRALANPRRTRR